MSNNGHKPFIAGLPIVGQPFTLKSWALHLLLMCNCSSRPEPLIIFGQAGAESARCPHCKRQLVLKQIGFDAAGQLQLSVGMTSAPLEAAHEETSHV